LGALSVDILDSASFAGLGAFSLGAFAFGAFSLAIAFAFRAFSLGAFFSGAFGAVFLLAGVTSAGFSSSALAGAFSLGAASTAILGAFSFVATLGLAASTGNFALFVPAIMSAFTFVKCSVIFCTHLEVPQFFVFLLLS
jgi:hypothetical protein